MTIEQKAHQPTEAQRRVLERFAKGGCIDHTWRRPKFLWGPFIARPTMDVLIRNGWVRHGAITEAGRSALGAMSPPGGDA